MIKAFIVTLGVLVFMFGCLIRGGISDDEVSWQLLLLTAVGFIMIFVGAYFPK